MRVYPVDKHSQLGWCLSRVFFNTGNEKYLILATNWKDAPPGELCKAWLRSLARTDA